jgi:hypothetical protein
MKEKERKNFITLLIASVLICCSFSALADQTTDTPAQIIKITKPVSFDPKGNISIISENFSAGSLPPSGWIHNKTNLNGTWKIDSVRYHSPLYSASVWRGPNCHGLQDEWLITPVLNFSDYLNPTQTNRIFLEFWWYTDIYVVQNSLIYFNVSISTNGGLNWTNIWTAKNQSGFPQFTFSRVGMPIELSEYRNESTVQIAFQYCSNKENWSEAQFFAIDDIDVFTEASENFTCDGGGPYNWYYYRQNDYTPKGVRFHGTIAEGYNPLSCRWLWDFGDGNTSQIPLYTYHYYKDPGFYNISLRVTYGNLIAFYETTLYLFLSAPPDLGVTLKPISIPGIIAEIKNPGDYDATNVNWSMTVSFGPLKMREKIVANGTIDTIGNHSTQEIKSKYFFGFRLIQIQIIATPENIYGFDKSFSALKIGPIIILIKEL